MKQHGFFDENDRLKELSKTRDPLERLNIYIDWEQFRGMLNKVLQKEPKGPGGRPPFDYVMMFKILVLQRFYNINDAQAEYQIENRWTCPGWEDSRLSRFFTYCFNRR
jgi:hypothetical protein